MASALFTSLLIALINFWNGIYSSSIPSLLVWIFYATTFGAVTILLGYILHWKKPSKLAGHRGGAKNNYFSWWLNRTTLWVGFPLFLTAAFISILTIALTGKLIDGVLSANLQEPEVVTREFLVTNGITYGQNGNEPLTGIVEIYHENGELSYRGNYIDGERAGLSETFHLNGQLWVIEHYIDGERDGLWEGFYPDGQLWVRDNYVDGQRNGLSEGFHSNGLLASRVNYIDGQRAGLQEEFNENGNLIKTETYRNGELIGETSY